MNRDLTPGKKGFYQEINHKSSMTSHRRQHNERVTRSRHEEFIASDRWGPEVRTRGQDRYIMTSGRIIGFKYCMSCLPFHKLWFNNCRTSKMWDRPPPREIHLKKLKLKWGKKKASFFLFWMCHCTIYLLKLCITFQRDHCTYVETSWHY